MNEKYNGPMVVYPLSSLPHPQPLYSRFDETRLPRDCNVCFIEYEQKISYNQLDF